MAKQAASSKKEFVWDPGTVSDKQRQFLHSTALFTAYGGAKGGGKSHIARIKAVGGAFSNSGIKILMMRNFTTNVRTIISKMDLWIKDLKI